MVSHCPTDVLQHLRHMRTTTETEEDLHVARLLKLVMSAKILGVILILIRNWKAKCLFNYVCYLGRQKRVYCRLTAAVVLPYHISDRPARV